MSITKTSTVSKPAAGPSHPSSRCTVTPSGGAGFKYPCTVPAARSELRLRASHHTCTNVRHNWVQRSRAIPAMLPGKAPCIVARACNRPELRAVGGEGEEACCRARPGGKSQGRGCTTCCALISGFSCGCRLFDLIQNFCKKTLPWSSLEVQCEKNAILYYITENHIIDIIETLLNRYRGYWRKNFIIFP